MVRSGMVFAGKVYETDGATAIGVHEAEAIRPLAPVPTAPSLRIFRSEFQPLRQGLTEEPHFFYGNPVALAGPSQTVTFPNFTTQVAALPMVAAVVVAPAYRVEIADADDLILGLTLICLLRAPSVELGELETRGGLGRSMDLGGAIGPVITTPDELDDFLSDQTFGREYRLDAVTRVNGVERERGNVAHLHWTFAEAISHASQSCTVKEGDIFAMGPVTTADEPVLLNGGDEVQIAVEQLGTLTLRLAEDL